MDLIDFLMVYRLLRVTVTVVGNGIGDPISNPGFYFIMKVLEGSRWESKAINETVYTVCKQMINIK